MGFFILKCDDLVIDSNTAMKLSELLSNGISVSESYRTKTFEISSARSNMTLSPFPASEVARMQLELAERREDN
jgi:hypothetical protein